ncbi:hypothetical protein HDU83_001830 [Entophlyctis luteolus]|nr:hypothetical protein HDU83_001830 [Entophlyctis luteolus]
MMLHQFHLPHRHAAISPLDDLFLASSTATSASIAADVSVSGESLYSTPSSCSPSLSHEFHYDQQQQQQQQQQRDLSSVQLLQRAFSRDAANGSSISAPPVLAAMSPETLGSHGSSFDISSIGADRCIPPFEPSPLALTFAATPLGMGIAPFAGLDGFFTASVHQQHQQHFPSSQNAFLHHHQQLTPVSPTDTFFALHPQQHQQQQTGLNQKQQPHLLLQHPHQPLALYPSPLLSGAGAETLAQGSPMLADPAVAATQSSAGMHAAASAPTLTCLPLSMLSPTPPGLLSVAYGSTLTPTADVPGSTFLDSDDSDEEEEEDDEEDEPEPIAPPPAPTMTVPAPPARSASTSSIVSASSQARNARAWLQTAVKRSNSSRMSSSGAVKPYSRPTSAGAVKKDDAPVVAGAADTQPQQSSAVMAVAAAAVAAVAASEARKPKKRHILQDWETEILNKCFEQNQFLQANKAQELSAQLGMTVNQVRIWFQNKRAYVKRQAAKNEEDGSDA